MPWRSGDKWPQAEQAAVLPMSTASSPALTEAQPARGRGLDQRPSPGDCVLTLSGQASCGALPGAPIRGVPRSLSTISPGALSHSQPLRLKKHRAASETPRGATLGGCQPAPRIVPVCKYSSKEQCRDAERRRDLQPGAHAAGGFVFKCTLAVTRTHKMPDSQGLHPNILHLQR